jgi:hypothetical protein
MDRRISVLSDDLPEPALVDQSFIFVIDFAIAPLGLGGHGLELASAAVCGFKAITSCLLHY